VAENQKPQGENAASVFVPATPVTFDPSTDSVRLFKCSQETNKIRRLTLYQLPVIGISAYYLLSSLYHMSFWWSLFWSVPFYLAFSMFRNVLENQRYVIDELHLKNDGTHVVLKCVSGRRIELKISSLAPAENAHLM